MKVVGSSDFATFHSLQGFSGVAALRAVPETHLIEPEHAVTDAGQSPASGSRDGAVQPNITQVKAPETWGQGFTGEGMVIGIIDTGVRYTHDALVNQYRGNRHDGTFNHHHNWWDPGSPAVPVPYDGDGHGTHVAGVAVGDDGGLNRIGVAPDAQWMACRGCPGGGCPMTALLECAEFMAAPWNLSGEDADPDLRPHVVNNSWGDCQFFYSGYFQGVIDSWQAAGIVPVFANGNAAGCALPDDPPCGSVGNPARYGNVVGVGSTGTADGLYAPHSMKGPTDDAWTDDTLGFPVLKPAVVAPGVNIRSAIHIGDEAYQSDGWSGTSMSTPHVAGAIALLWQAAPCLVGDYAATPDPVTVTAVSTPAPPFEQMDGSCGQPPFDLAAGQSCALLYAMAPQEAGFFSSMVTITSNAPGGERTVFMDGSAEDDSDGNLSMTPPGLSFAEVVAGSASAPSIVVVKNLREIAITGMIIQSDHPERFPVDGSDCMDALPPGGTCQLQVIFTPAQPGLHFSNITIDNDQFFFATLPVVGNAIATSDGLFGDRFEGQ